MTPEEEKSKPKDVKRKTIYDELKEGMEKARRSLSEVATKPESRRYGPDEEYIFLVHAPLDIESRTAQLGLEEFSQADRPLNTSLIDQEHNWTFEGMSGLIIQPPSTQEDILGAWSYDSGLNDMVREEDQPNPHTLLTETRKDNYNQVNIRAGKVEGVYIRVKEDGSELGDQQRNAQLREFARQHGLPVAEIVVVPQTFEDSVPHIHKPTEDLTTVEFSKNGKKFRVDALLADPSRQRPGDIAVEGYYFRAREIDAYGQAGGDVLNPGSLRLITEQLSVLLTGDLDESTVEVIEKIIRRYSSTLE